VTWAQPQRVTSSRDASLIAYPATMAGLDDVFTVLVDTCSPRGGIGPPAIDRTGQVRAAVGWYLDDLT
jgi:hypothetical protein